MFPNVTVPEPTAFFFPRWFTDPLYRGSYSNWPASLVPQHHTNLRATLGRLWFAGEALSEKYFGVCLCQSFFRPFFGDAIVLIFLTLTGFLHGAYYEGEDAGASVAQCLEGRGCTVRPHIQDIYNVASYDV